MTRHERLRVDLGPRGYDILVGEDLLAQADRYLAPILRGKGIFIITDRTVADLHLGTLARALDRANIAYQAKVLPPGEQSKDFRHLEDLVEYLLQAKVERRSALVALGGGVVGDLAGFAAAIVLRGVDHIQIPTTLLSQVDASVGGKTGINTRRGKNLVGSFHQPRLVLADTGVLSTLSRRELLAGYAEVVKYGLINDPTFFAWLESHGIGVIDGNRAAQRHAVITSCAAKAAIVAADEREEGTRALLNLGHTFAHALEAETGFSGELLHGEAVAIGLVMAFDLSVQLNLCPAEDATRLRRHLAAIGLPTGLEAASGRVWNAANLIEHMGRDKKVRDGGNVFVLARGIGQAFLCPDVEPSEVEALLTGAVAA